MLLAVLFLVGAVASWRPFRQFAILFVVAALLAALPVPYEGLFWLAWILVLIVALRATVSTGIEAAKILLIVTAVAGIIGFVSSHDLADFSIPGIELQNPVDVEDE